MNREVWQATVYRVAKSQDMTEHEHMHTYFNRNNKKTKYKELTTPPPSALSNPCVSNKTTINMALQQTSLV